MRISLAVVVAVAVAVACLGVRHQSHHPPSGYDQIATVDGATLYARQDHSGEGWLEVVVQRDGDELCGSRGALSPVRAAALCDDHGPGTYTFVLPVARGGPATVGLCERETGAHVSVPVVRTPGGWPVDFAMAVRVTSPGDDATGIGRC